MVHTAESPKGGISPTGSLPWLGLKVLLTRPTGGGCDTAGDKSWGGKGSVGCKILSGGSDGSFWPQSL